jgi:hypothetical protein
MLYYIYYGYVASVTAYKLYEYWEIFKVGYTIASYTYSGMYKWVKKESVIDMDDLHDWELCGNT